MSMTTQAWPAPLPPQVIIFIAPDSISSRACPILQDSGYVVLSANDGSSAMRIIADYKGSIDLMVAGPLVGDVTVSQVVESVVAKHPAVHVLYLSGATDDDTGLYKPQQSVLAGRFNPYALRRAVRGVLGPPGLAPAKYPAAPTVRQTVLLVERDDKFRRLLDFKLAASGYLVRDACSSLGALQLIRAHSIDVLIVQLRAAEVSGAQLAVIFLEKNPRARIIFTLEALDNFEAKAPTCTSIRKPFTPDELAQKVSAVVNA